MSIFYKKPVSKSAPTKSSKQTQKKIEPETTVTDNTSSSQKTSEPEEDYTLSEEMKMNIYYRR